MKQPAYYAASAQTTSSARQAMTALQTIAFLVVWSIMRSSGLILCYCKFSKRCTSSSKFCIQPLTMCHASHLDIYTVSDRLPRYLLGPKGHSYDVCETSFQEALGTAKPRWDWLAERVSPKEITNDGIGYPGVPNPNNWLHLSPDADGKIPRPELDTFSLAMVGGGKVSAASHPFGMVPEQSCCVQSASDLF